MSKLLILYNYNKYYNRIIKKKDTFEEYQALITPANENTPAQYRGFIRQNINFDFQDGVHAEVIFNVEVTDPVFAQSEQPDYLVLEESYIDTDETVIKKLSRWFVMEATRSRGCQYSLSLRRDLLSDYYNEVLNAPVFIERGNPTINDPAIFNKEGFSFNQIKKSEFLLSNNKRSGKGGGWIVGYLNRDGTSSSSTILHNLKAQAEIPENVTDFNNLSALTRNIINAGEAYQYEISYGNVLQIESSFEVYGSNETKRVITSLVYEDREVNISSLVERYYDEAYLHFKSKMTEAFAVERVTDVMRGQFGPNPQNIGSLINDWFEATFGQDHIIYTSNNELYDNRIIIKDGKYYRIKISSARSGPFKWYTKSEISAGSDAISSAVRTELHDMLGPNIEVSTTTAGTCKPVGIGKELVRQWIRLEPVGYDELDFSIPTSSTRNKLYDAPYDIFCIPFGSVKVFSNNTLLFETWKNEALPVARAIALAGSTAYVSDIQILPYCPFEEILNSDGDIDITSFTENKDYSFITHEVSGVDTNCGIIIYPKTSKGTFDIEIDASEEVYLECIEENSSPLEKKVKAETKFARFVSPNFSSIFDINVQKNKGISRINVDYFFKPFTPYIHVAPYFSGLYGEDFNDPKGLICSGDYSIATASDQWQLYQIQNKNYESIFNRQIQNLDVNNQLNYELTSIKGKIGTWASGITGAGAGAIAGSMIAPGIGTAIGAVVGAVGGGVTSGIGAKKDLEYLRKSQTEARSFQNDMYTYQLGNVQALPNTLTRVSAFTENNKIFPFIEFYDCTEEEKQALRDKIHYNGMTIMRIGNIINFIGLTDKYVQGQLIRLEGIDEDSHVIAEIANEIKQGAYYYGDSE